VAKLPKPTTVLPREKPIPKPKALTKWQKFAQKKGIVKHKRSKLVFDQDADEWRRRHGYKKAGDANDIQVIEAKPGDKPGFDPFSEMDKAKKERVRKNNRQQADNIKADLKAGNKQALPLTLRLAASLPTVGKGAPAKRKDLKDDIKSLSRHSGISTASMGKFDRRLKGGRLGWLAGWLAGWPALRTAAAAGLLLGGGWHPNSLPHAPPAPPWSSRGAHRVLPGRQAHTGGALHRAPPGSTPRPKGQTALPAPGPLADLLGSPQCDAPLPPSPPPLRLQARRTGSGSSWASGASSRPSATPSRSAAA
jgi:hypothetical protein